MSTHQVVASTINTLNYIDLSVPWPVWSQCPECWPSSTDTSGHMGNVGNEQAIGPGLLALQSHRLSPTLTLVRQ